MSANGTGNRSRAQADDLLIAALATGQTNENAAAAAGVSARTVNRRLAEPAFKRRIQSLRGELIARALGRVSDGIAAAVDVMRALLGAESEAVRLGAARSLIDACLKLRESVDMEERLALLEEAAKKTQGEP